MNTDTGAIYYDEDEIEMAIERGEPLVKMAPAVAKQLTEAEIAARLDLIAGSPIDSDAVVARFFGSFGDKIEKR